VVPPNPPSHPSNPQTCSFSRCRRRRRWSRCPPLNFPLAAVAHSLSQSGRGEANNSLNASNSSLPPSFPLPPPRLLPLLAGKDPFAIRPSLIRLFLPASHIRAGNLCEVSSSSSSRSACPCRLYCLQLPAKIPHKSESDFPILLLRLFCQRIAA
jgi:hypothetical protein